MPLPQDGTAWPLPGHADRYRRMRKARAYWGGVPSAIMGAQDDAAGGGVDASGAHVSDGAFRRLGGAVRRFWGGRESAGTETDTRRHLPIPSDIATIGAELLFSEPLRIRVEGPTYPQDVKAPDGTVIAKAGDPLPETQAAQQRIERCLARINFGATLLASAETGNALGSSTLRIALDKAGPIRDQPMIVRTDADAAFPEYQWGMLVAVTFWSLKASTNSGSRTRLLERHDLLAGTIEYGLYVGTTDGIGKQVPLNSRQDTALLGLQGALVGMTSVVRIVDGGGHSAVSIPNMLPDPLDSGANVGRSDFTPTTYGLFDDADKAYTDMMDELDDAKSRLFLADAMLERRGTGKGLGWDADQRVFRLNLPPSETASGNLPIEKTQFDLKTTERLEGIDAIRRMAIESAGYDRASMGDDDMSGQMTATEVRARQRRSLSTRDKKAAWWRSALADLLTTFLLVDVQQFPSSEVVAGAAVSVQAFPVTVEFAEAVQPSMSELLADAVQMRAAEAADDEQVVRYVWPSMSATEVDETVRSIQAMRGEPAAEPLGLNPAAGGADFADQPGVLDIASMDASELKAKYDALGAAVRAGVSGETAARQLGLFGLAFTGVPTTVRVAESEAAGLEDK